jgi:hypothetical protein
MNELPYKCKMCYRHGIAHYDPECPALTLGIWSKNLICDPCGVHREQVMKRARGIAWVASKLIYLSAMEGDKVDKAIEQVRSVLVQRTRELAEFVCRRHRKEFTWEMAFVDNIMRSPGKAEQYVWLYDRMIANNRALPLSS